VPRFPCLFVTFSAFPPHFPPDSCPPPGPQRAHRRPKA
jgi:hypothetical protein